MQIENALLPHAFALYGKTDQTHHSAPVPWVRGFSPFITLSTKPNPMGNRMCIYAPYQTMVSEDLALRR